MADYDAQVILAEMRAQFAATTERLNRLDDRLQDHQLSHLKEADATASYRQAQEGRVRALEVSLQTRTVLGIAGTLLAAFFQPLLSQLGVKHS